MADSDEDQPAMNETLSLTSFLFGNIDSRGQLEGDVFDSDCKRQLASLSRLGLGSLLRQVTDDGEEDSDDNESDDEMDNDDDDEVYEKSPSAVDFSDINEVADENFNVKNENVSDEDDLPLNKSDAELMPPPPAPAGETWDASGDGRKWCTPLASMMPSKYASVPICELFPNFRPDAVLRFSTLFGAGKASHLPKIWKNVKRKKKKRVILEDGERLTGEERRLLIDESGRNSPEAISRMMQLNFGSPPSPSQCFSDDEEKFLKPQSAESGSGNHRDGGQGGEGDQSRPREADWRLGPAQLWYDMLDVPITGDDFDYGFRLNPKNEMCEEKKILESKEERSYDGDDEDDEYPDDVFHMITQYNWEDDIIWNGDDIKHKTNQKRKNMAAGWVPSSYNRTAQAFSHPSKSVIPFVTSKSTPKTKNNSPTKESTDDMWYSIFPVENEELVYGRWEDNIIWDPDNMDEIPEPTVLTLDPNDENIILGIPEDVDPATLTQGEPPVKVKIPHPHVKKSKMMLGKAGVITVIEEDPPPPPPKADDKDPFNISNDEFYQARSSEQAIKMTMGGGMLQHSTPVVELQAPFIPTYMGEKKLRLFHRQPMKRFSHGLLSSPGPHPVLPLFKEIKKKAKLREQERIAAGGGDIFFMRTPEDLTGKDGDLVLVEYCEEYPPLLSQVGMCTRLKNYYKRRAGNDKGPPVYNYGEDAIAHTSPFLGAMHPGQSIQTLENNMYRAPIYAQQVVTTDFLIIRTRNGYNIRELDAVFTVGQECPLYEVPGPNSKRANNFMRDFLQVFIYRLFWKSKDMPRRLKMDDIKRAFPAHSESSIRKRLKPCADFKRTGVDSNWWVIKSEFRLPTEEEIRAMVSPEQCCSFFSMSSAEQRLRDAGYGDKFLSAIEDDDDDTQKLDDEIKCAPWVTTRAYIQAVKGKCLLQLTGAADPTGCGEGFSYVRIPNKPTQNKEEQEQQPKRIVTGTDADLRRLSLNNAKNLLRQYGVPEEEIKKLSRWEVIDVVRTLSTEKAKAGEEGMNKFSRGNRFSIAEHQERYKEECQRLFELQNRVLASEELLSTDEGSSEEEDNDSDMEEKGKYIENILANRKTTSQMSLEKEEQERRELQKLIMGEDEKDGDRKKTKKEEEENSQFGFGTPGRVLRITRTFRAPDGREYTRTETVRKVAVLDTYVKIRISKDDTFIKDFAGQLDEVQKEEMKRERRRLQEQLRRIKRNQERQIKGIVTPPRTKKPKLKPDLKLKCGACGQVGHMRTNKACPMYTGYVPTTPQVANTSMNNETQEEEEEEEEMTIDRAGGSSGMMEEPDEFINVDGTKITLSSKVIKHAEEMTRRSLVLKVPRDQMRYLRRRRAGTVVHCDYLTRKDQSVNRRRIDPVITLSTIFEGILNEMRDMSDAQPFLFPVNAKQVPDYYNIVQHPMDLQSIRENLRQKKYQSREEFLSDVSQMVENSRLYNGVKSTLTATAQKMLELCIDSFAEKEERLMRLEKAINPLLDDDDQVAFDYILDNIVNSKLFAMQEAWPFMKPVNKKNVKDYYEIIEQPMDLSTVAKKVKTHKYHSRAEFMSDMELLLRNSTKYNGADSAFTQKAQVLVQVCQDSLNEYEEHLEALEQKISLAQERALEQAENDSLGSLHDDDDQFVSEDAREGESAMGLVSPDGGGYDEEGETRGGKVSMKRSRSESPSQRNVLEEDLEFSEEEDDMGRKALKGAPVAHHVGMDREHGTVGEREGAAEAMVQLGGDYDGDYYQMSNVRMKQDPHSDSELDVNSQVEIEADDESANFDESIILPDTSGVLIKTEEVTMDVDASYDPSAEFLGGMMMANEEESTLIHNDLAISESEDEDESQRDSNPLPDEGGNLWF